MYAFTDIIKKVIKFCSKDSKNRVALSHVYVDKDHIIATDSYKAIRIKRSELTNYKNSEIPNGVESLEEPLLLNAEDVRRIDSLKGKKKPEMLKTLAITEVSDKFVKFSRVDEKQCGEYTSTVARNSTGESYPDTAKFLTRREKAEEINGVTVVKVDPKLLYEALYPVLDQKCVEIEVGKPTDRIGIHCEGIDITVMPLKY